MSTDLGRWSKKARLVNVVHEQTPSVIYLSAVLAPVLSALMLLAPTLPVSVSFAPMTLAPMSLAPISELVPAPMAVFRPAPVPAPLPLL